MDGSFGYEFELKLEVIGYFFSKVRNVNRNGIAGQRINAFFCIGVEPYILPLIETEKRLPDSKPAVDLKVHMREVLLKLRSEMIGSALGASGVSLAEGSATAHAPSQQGGRAIG